MTLATFAAFEAEVWRQGQPSGVDLLNLGGLGIAGEAGEVADEIKKHLFHGRPLDRAKLLKEVGDVLWYAMAVCRALDASMEDAADACAAKLRLRYPNGFNAADSAARVDVEPATPAALARVLDEAQRDPKWGLLQCPCGSRATKHWPSGAVDCSACGRRLVTGGRSS